MSNKLLLYGKNITSVNFLLFQHDVLVETINGVQDLVVSDLWAAVVPGTVAAGNYQVVAESGSKVLGQEAICWDGTSVTTNQKQLTEIHRIHGLDAQNPLQVSSQGRTSGADIVQTVVINSGTTTVTRI
jgi:hypothetical protein